MLTTYATKLLRPSLNTQTAVCPFCREAGRLVVIRIHGKAQQRVVGCRCERRKETP